MRRGCLWQIFLAGIIIFLLIFFYLSYLAPRIKETAEVLRRTEEVTKRSKRRIRKLERKEVPEETTGIPEIDEYQRMLKSARQKLRGLRRMITPR